MGVPKNGWFIVENSIKIRMIWGYPYFRKPPNVDVLKKLSDLSGQTLPVLKFQAFAASAIMAITTRLSFIMFGKESGSAS